MANWICTFPSPLPRPLNIRPPRESSRDFTHLLPHHHQEQHGTPSQSHHEHHPGNVESQWTQYGHHVGYAIASGAQKDIYRSFLSSAHPPNSTPLKTVDQQNAQHNPRPPQG
jgi:hypothetical protein